MERNHPYFGASRMSAWMMHKFERNEEMVITLPVIPHPRTPNEPMEFLARSWTPSAQDIARALAQSHDQTALQNVDANPETSSSAGPQMTSKAAADWRSGSFGKWFQGRETSSANGQAVKRKDKARLDNSHVHAALSVAGLAAGLASVAAADKCHGSGDADCNKMKMAVASATELMASHCIQLAELAGADRDGLANAVRSSVDFRSAGDLLTLTAAAATALRAEATLRARLPKDAKKNATISPYDRNVADFNVETRKEDMVCKGELLQQTHKGAMRWKHVRVYINTKSQVMIKIKNKHIGGAFSKRKKCVVYGVCDESGTWPFRKEKQEMEEVWFGVKTGKGFLELKCRNKIHKQKWVDGIRSQLRQVGSMELTAEFLDSIGLK
uniref:VAN3-binding protein n=1 Tax=Kalanchoe fedtschenkoi TaxID=63787 RepID=A0A7N0SZW8_KALFE